MMCRRAVNTRYCFLWAADSDGEALTLRLCALCMDQLVPAYVQRGLFRAARKLDQLRFA
jgi:hypothetical protein